MVAFTLPNSTPQLAPKADTAAPETRRARRFSITMLLVLAVLNIIAIFALPHDKALRYQVPNDPDAPTISWIYQRIHSDPHPIDIAFLGTSRTGMSIHSARLQDDLAREGIRANAVNFYAVRSGVNLQYVIAKELLDNRKVKLLVLEIDEREERKPHALFFQYADTSDILTAPWLINANYLADIGRLPARQMRLAWETAMQRLGVGTQNAVTAPYVGANLDHAQFMTTVANVTHSRDTGRTLAEMENDHRQEVAGLTPPLLPKRLSALEYRLSRYYEARILELAQAHGTKVAFLYTPEYGGPPTPPPYQIYADRAGLLNPWPLIHDYQYWWDEIHMNWRGAKVMTDYVAAELAKRPELRPATAQN